mmetsp:Transcript_33826/g.95174  ORF Transcript_33826/g.95174 Transcript_33826/m.95174 type:complete len:1659 (-) Transcript_33826:37-5013(-)
MSTKPKQAQDVGVAATKGRHQGTRQKTQQSKRRNKPQANGVGANGHRGPEKEASAGKGAGGAPVKSTAPPATVAAGVAAGMQPRRAPPETAPVNGKPAGGGRAEGGAKKDADAPAQARATNPPTQIMVGQAPGGQGYPPANLAGAIPRTHSAPPDLKEQQKAMIFYPAKTGGRVPPTSSYVPPEAVPYYGQGPPGAPMYNPYMGIPPPYMYYGGQQPPPQQQGASAHVPGAVPNGTASPGTHYSGEGSPHARPANSPGGGKGADQHARGGSHVQAPPAQLNVGGATGGKGSDAAPVAGGPKAVGQPRVNYPSPYPSQQQGVPQGQHGGARPQHPGMMPPGSGVPPYGVPQGYPGSYGFYPPQPAYYGYGGYPPMAGMPPAQSQPRAPAQPREKKKLAIFNPKTQQTVNQSPPRKSSDAEKPEPPATDAAPSAKVAGGTAPAPEASPKVAPAGNVGSPILPPTGSQVPQVGSPVVRVAVPMSTIVGGTKPPAQIEPISLAGDGDVAEESDRGDGGKTPEQQPAGDEGQEETSALREGRETPAESGKTASASNAAAALTDEAPPPKSSDSSAAVPKTDVGGENGAESSSEAPDAKGGSASPAKYVPKWRREKQRGGEAKEGESMSPEAGDDLPPPAMGAKDEGKGPASTQVTREPAPAPVPAGARSEGGNTPVATDPAGTRVVSSVEGDAKGAGEGNPNQLSSQSVVQKRPAPDMRNSVQYGSIPLSVVEKFPYPEGVWEPRTKKGRMVYPRDFLLLFREHCPQRPLKMASERIFSDDEPHAPSHSHGAHRGARAHGPPSHHHHPNVHGPMQGRSIGPPQQAMAPGGMVGPMHRGGVGGGMDWREQGARRYGNGVGMAPGGKNFAHPGGGMMRPPGFSPHGMVPPNRGGFGPRGGRGHPQQMMRMQYVEPLKKSENAWQRPQETDEDKKKMLKINGLLNRLTKENFGPVSDQICDVVLEAPQILTNVIAAVFEKALLEPGYCAMYADLCVKVSQKAEKVTVEGKDKTFMQILLNKCQEKFEKRVSYEKTPEDEELDEEEWEEKLYMIRYRVLGNITFIGELFKKKMLVEKIMHGAIQILISRAVNEYSGEDVECLCLMLTNIGRDLDHKKAGCLMDRYFQEMERISKDPKFESRIRFKVDDVVALRARNWVVVKKDDIGRKEGDRRGGGGRNKDRMARGRDHQMRRDEDRRREQDRHRRRLQQQQQQQPQQPQQPRTQAGNQGKGAVRPANNIRTPVTPERTAAGNGGVGTGTGKGGWGPAGGQTPPSKVPPRSARPPAMVETRRPAGGSTRATSVRSPGGASPGRYVPPSRAGEAASAGKTSGSDEDTPPAEDSEVTEETEETAATEAALSEEDRAVKLERAVNMLIKEYLLIKDATEAVECVKELNAPNEHHVVVVQAIQTALDQKDEHKKKAEEAILQLFRDLHKVECLSSADFVKGLTSCCSSLNEIAMDFPNAPSLIGRVLAAAVVDGILEDWSFVLPAVADFRDARFGTTRALPSKLLGAACQALAQLSEDPAALTTLLARSNLDLKEAFREAERSPKNFEEFLARYDLTAALSGKNIKQAVVDGPASLKEYLKSVAEDARFTEPFISEVLEEILSHTDPAKEHIEGEKKWKAYSPALATLACECFEKVLNDTIRKYAMSKDVSVGTVQDLLLG